MGPGPEPQEDDPQDLDEVAATPARVGGETQIAIAKEGGIAPLIVMLSNGSMTPFHGPHVKPRTARTSSVQRPFASASSHFRVRGDLLPGGDVLLLAGVGAGTGPRVL